MTLSSSSPHTAAPAQKRVIRGWSANGERQSRARVAVQALTHVVARSISTKEAAEILRVDRSRISRRIGKTLWAYDIRGQKRMPRWQFLDSDLLPGLAVIVPVIPREVTPAMLDAFMRAPQPDFGGQASRASSVALS